MDDSAIRLPDMYFDSSDMNGQSIYDHTKEKKLRDIQILAEIRTQ